ncbi:MAG: hypothetical protein EOP54_16545, partial [Sphingobacteriales bacterium]
INPIGGYYTNTLPKGLKISEITGAITGTPVSGSLSTDYVVTGYNDIGGHQSTVNITVTSTDANLDTLIANSSSVSPAFDKDVLAYADTVGKDTVSIKIIARLSDASSALKINGTDAVSGVATDIPLVYGVNNIPVEVTASAGNVKAYTLSITRVTPPPTVSYANPIVFGVNNAVEPVTPTNQLVDAYAYKTTKTVLAATGNYGLGVDVSGNIYVADYIGNQIKKYTPDGSGVEVIGSGFDRPIDVKVDAAGNVYVANAGNDLIQKIAAGSGEITTYSTPGLTSPNKLALDSAGNIYIADRNGTGAVKRIRVSDDVMETVFSGGFIALSGLDVDNQGYIYTSDVNRNEVKKYAPDGQSSVVLANFLSFPTDVSVDAAGNVYIYNANSREIRKIVAGTNGSVVISGGVQYQGQGMDVDYAGNVILAENSLNVISRLAPIGGYHLGEPLPKGLSFDSTTGAISGTPTVIAPAKDYRVTAYNFVGPTTIPVNIKVASTDATLLALALNNSNLSPAFSPDTIAYTAWVNNATTGTDITADVTVAGATVKVNGNTVTPGLASGEINLNEGDNTITVEVTADDQVTTKTYTVVVHRAITPPTLSYSSGSPTFVTGTAITPIQPSATEVHAPGYNTRERVLVDSINNPTGLTTDAAGNIYVASIGGSVYKIPAGGGAGTVIASDINTPFNLTVDAVGNVYVAALGETAIKKIPADGSAIVDINTGLTVNGIAIDSLGNLYYTRTLDHSLNKVSVNGGASVKLADDFINPYGVAVDADGNIYIADAGSGEGTSSVKKMLAGTDSLTNVGTGYLGAISVGVDAVGNIFIADGGDNKIIKIAAADSSRNVIGSGYTGLFGIALDNTGKIYLSDNGVSLVKQISPGGGYVLGTPLPKGLTLDETSGIISGTPTKAAPLKNYIITAYNSGGGTSATTDFTVKSNNAWLANFTIGISTDTIAPVFAQQTLEYTASTKDSIITITPVLADTSATVTIGGNLVASGMPSDTISLNPEINTINIVVTAEDGATTKTYSLNIYRDASVLPVFAYDSLQVYPRNVATDKEGNIYVADRGRDLYKIPKEGGSPVDIGYAEVGVAVDTAGNIYTTIPGFVTKIPVDGGAPVNIPSGVNSAFGIAVDVDGNVFVTDTENNVVKKVPTNGGAPTNVGTSLGSPSAVATDAAGNIYVADINNNKIKKIIAGTNITVDVKSSILVTSLAVDPAGNIYYPDFKTLYKVDAGSNTTKAIWTSPDVIFGVTVDPFGNIFVGSNTSVVKIVPQGGYYLGKPLPYGLSFDQTTATISGTPLYASRNTYPVT